MGENQEQPQQQPQQQLVGAMIPVLEPFDDDDLELWLRDFSRIDNGILKPLNCHVTSQILNYSSHKSRAA